MNITAKNIIEQIKSFLNEHGLMDSKLLVGFSGGGDSLCLLDAVNKLGINIVAAHLNHNWRPQEAIKEQQKAENFCKERGIEFYTETLPEGLPQTEEEARMQRYEFFNRAAEKYSAQGILTGHTRTDNVETVLYRIIKGTGIAGLKGIPALREQKDAPSIYRPLLNLTREDCIEYCLENNLIPSEDSSNYNQKYSRNRIRLSLLPELRTFNPEIDLALLRLSEIAGEADEIIEECIASIGVFNEEINTQKLLSVFIPLQKRILTDFLAKNDVEYSFERINDLLNFIQDNKTSKSGKTFSVGKDIWVFVSSKEIKIITKSEESPLPELKIEPWQGKAPEKFPNEKSKTIYADLTGVKQPLFLRKRQPGDVFQPFGMQEKTKLKKYLINRGIPKHERENLPLLVNEEEVLWVVGVGMSEKLRVITAPTHIISIS